jgi:hypothetical protein
MKSAAFGTPRVWDVAAGAVLVREAGGVVLTRARPRAPWTPFELFQAKEDIRDRPLEGIRKWSAPLLVGHRDIVEIVAASRPKRLGFLPLPGFRR